MSIAGIERWRTLLFWVLVVGVIGILAELLLLGHDDDTLQFIPLGLGAAYLLAFAWYGATRSRGAVLAVRVVSGLACVSAAVGIFLHYRANVEWELETTPTMHGMELFREAITGSLPLLAPGAMLQLGLLGLLWSYRHPALATSAGGRTLSTES
ncbi:MAG: hypothetical protein V9E87_03480 [Gemmatimonadales bacterium]